MIGPVISSPLFGALAVFTTREDAEAFAESDPFVIHGVVSRWSVAEWKETLSQPNERIRRPVLAGLHGASRRVARW
jgi:hypothetical protein